MQQRTDFSKSSIFGLLNHCNALNRTTLSKLVRHSKSQVVLDTLRLLVTHNLVPQVNPQKVINFILEHTHIELFLAAIKALATNKVLSADVMNIVCGDDDAYIFAEVILILTKQKVYDSNAMQLIKSHHAVRDLINILVLLDEHELFNQKLMQFSLNYHNPKKLLDILTHFLKSNALDKALLNRLMFCLDNSSKLPDFIAENLLQRQLNVERTRLFKPVLAVIEEEPSAKLSP